MAVAGKVALTPKGNFVIGTKYNALDVVLYNNDLFISKVENTNVTPVDGDVWMLAFHSDTTTFDQRITSLENQITPVTALTNDSIDAWFE